MPIRPNPGTGAKVMGAYHAPLHRNPKSLGSFIAGFKASVTSRAGRELNSGNTGQRNYVSCTFCRVTNISYGIKPITSASPLTSLIIRSTGIRMKKTRKTPSRRGGWQPAPGRVLYPVWGPPRTVSGPYGLRPRWHPSRTASPLSLRLTTYPTTQPSNYLTTQLSN